MRFHKPDPNRRPGKEYKQEHECTPEERTLIDEWYASAHRSNWPASRAKAWWTFRPTVRGVPCASYLAGHMSL